MTQKKENIFKRIKKWWKEELNEESRTIVKFGFFASMEGAIISGIATGVRYDRKMKQMMTDVYKVGVQDGMTAAYQDIARTSVQQKAPVTK